MNADSIIADVLRVLSASGLLPWPAAVLLAVILVLLVAAIRLAVARGVLLGPDSLLLPTTPPPELPSSPAIPMPPGGAPLDQQPTEPTP